MTRSSAGPVGAVRRWTRDAYAGAQVTGRLDRSGLGIRVPTFIVGRYIDVEVRALFQHAS